MIDLIKKIKIKEFCGKGSVNKFKKFYGLEVFETIKTLSSPLDKTYKSNQKFNARLLFIIKYNYDIKNITKNNKIMYFNGTDFIETVNNSTKKQWADINNQLNNIKEFYTYDQTKNILLTNYNKYLKKGGNKTLICDDIILFSSIYYHTKYLDDLDKNKNKLSNRIIFLINNKKSNICDICNSELIVNKFKIKCKGCIPKYPSIYWFKYKYPNNWEIKYNDNLNKIKSNKTNSLEWYLNKYGEDGNNMYTDRYVNHFNIISKLKKNKYSKISQDLFDSIKNNIKDLDLNELYYATHNGEYFIKLNKNNKLNQSILFLDFKYKNKIIEYNGKYWHNDVKDNLRKKTLENMGYKYKIITSDQYSRYNKSIEIIYECINFILND